MEKDCLVLLKKNGLAAEDGGTPSDDALLRYKDLYKQPLSAQFIEAVTSLVQAGGSKQQKTKAPAPASSVQSVAVQVRTRG